MQQQYSSIEEIELVLRVKKQSDTGLFKNQRLLGIKSGYISYYSKIPKQFVGNTRSLQLIGQLPKYTFSAQYVTKITYSCPFLEIQFLKDKLINKTSFKKIIQTTNTNVENQQQKANNNEIQNVKSKKKQQQNVNRTYWRFKSKQIDLSNTFVQQVKSCMFIQQEVDLSKQHNNNNKNNNNNELLRLRRSSLQPSLKLISNGFKIAQQQRQSKQISQIINERSSNYFSSQEIEREVKRRRSEMSMSMGMGVNKGKESSFKKKKKMMSGVNNRQGNGLQNSNKNVLSVIKVPQAYNEQQEIQRMIQGYKEKDKDIDKYIIERQDDGNGDKQKKQIVDVLLVYGDGDRQEDKYDKLMVGEQIIRQKQISIVSDNNKGLLVVQGVQMNKQSEIIIRVKQKKDMDDINKQRQQQNENTQKYQQSIVGKLQQINMEKLQQSNMEKLQQSNMEKQVFTILNQQNQQGYQSILKQQVDKENIRIDMIVIEEDNSSKQINKGNNIKQINNQNKLTNNYDQHQSHNQQITIQTIKQINTKQVQLSTQLLIQQPNSIINHHQLTNYQKQNKYKNQHKHKHTNNNIKSISINNKLFSKHQSSSIHQLQPQQTTPPYDQQQPLYQQNNHQPCQSLFKNQLIAKHFISNIQSLNNHYTTKTTQTYLLHQSIKNNQNQYQLFQSVKSFTINHTQQLLNKHQNDINKHHKFINQDQNDINKQQQFIMYTDFINYPSLIQNQSTYQLQIQQNNNSIYHHQNQLIFNNKYSSKLYNKFLKYKQIFNNHPQLQLQIQIKNNQNINKNNKTQQINQKPQITNSQQSIFYLRYKHYQGLVTKITQNITQNKNKNKDKFFNQNLKFKTTQTQNNPNIKDQQKLIENFINQLKLTLTPSNIIESYQSLNQIKKICIEEVFLYLKSNTFLINNYQHQHQQIGNVLKKLKQSILQREQLIIFLKDQNNEDIIETNILINKFIDIFLQQLLGIKKILSIKKNNQQVKNLNVNQNENTNKKETMSMQRWNCVVSIEEIKLNSYERSSQFSLFKYILRQKQTNNQCLIDLMKCQLYSAQQLFNRNTDNIRSVNKSNLNHKQKQYQINKSYHSSPSLKQHYQDYSNLLKQIQRHFYNSSILQLLTEQDLKTLLSLINPTQQQQQKQYSNINSSNSLSHVIQLLLKRFNKLQYKYKQSKNNLKNNNKNNKLFTQSQQFNLLHQIILISVNFINMKQILESYKKQQQNQKNNSGDIKLIEQQLSNQIIKLSYKIKNLIKQLRIKVNNLNENDIKEDIQSDQHFRLIRNISYLGQLIVYSIEQIYRLGQFPTKSNNLSDIINKDTLLIEGLQIMQLLQQIHNYPSQQINNKTYTSITTHRQSKLNKHRQYTHPLKYKLQILHLIQNTQNLHNYHTTLNTVLQLLITTINKQNQHYFIKTFDLLITLWRVNSISDKLLMETFLCIIKGQFSENSQFKQRIKYFINNQIKTQDKIRFFIQYPSLQKYYHQSILSKENNN